MKLIEHAARITGLVRGFGHDAALVGSVAVAVRTSPRMTSDVDVDVRVASDAESERLARGMQRAGLRLVRVIEQRFRGIVGTLRFVDPNSEPDRLPTNLVYGLSGIEPEVVAKATPIVLPRLVSGYRSHEWGTSSR